MTNVAESLVALSAGAAAQCLDLAVVIPTYNERENIPQLLDRLSMALEGLVYEVLIVDDDSPDGTWEAARQIALREQRIRFIRRIGRRGLASACLEGMVSTAAPYIVVMDGDLQHDESILPRMLAQARDQHLDVVVASRHAEGASMGDFAPRRVWLSNLGLRLSHLVLHTPVSDPMSGFFLVERSFLEEVIYRTSGVGFKVLVDLLASARRPVRLAEVPYAFRVREHGDSKLDAAVSLEYLYLLLDKLIGQLVPLRFAMYTLVGALGVVLHLFTLGALYLNHWSSFPVAQVAATLLVMTFNFLVNNLVTYRDASLRGKRLITGLLTFYLACAIGAAVNLSVSEDLFQRGLPWLLSGAAGLAISSVWNYGVTSVTTWRRRRR
ncbi:MAG TPA: glycosyltransferase [Bryobacteraceae bacterium]|nr:glycosyltransferase [Bryobacteraceae bacterium]